MDLRSHARHSRSYDGSYLETVSQLGKLPYPACDALKGKEDAIYLGALVQALHRIAGHLGGPVNCHLGLEFHRDFIPTNEPIHLSLHLVALDRLIGTKAQESFGKLRMSSRMERVYAVLKVTSLQLCCPPACGQAEEFREPELMTAKIAQE
ncbi:hypothetical protein P7K49_005604 [Saguinus oedipus]|uniref:Uncharacterized protein n=1 Tax=Saguinus oedipus TaxID=9490 RepID=A0ABQ9W047_SAGOE|nr:hypothetical protein P7K49_005604 [Saguinus oedipus]